jgi:hypothetical protein
MGVALFLIGLLAILAGIAMFIIALVRKRGWGVIRSLALGGVGLILAIVGIVVGVTQEAPKPVTPTQEPLPAPTEKLLGGIIKDLAYINAVNIPYSDDADPEWEGYDINLFWYDTKSELKHFRNITMLVTIELFTAKYNVETKQREIVRSVYKAEAQIDSSLSRIRIPFKDINVDPNVDDCSGIGKVTVHTPRQGDFLYDMEFVLLYEPD